MLAAAVPGGQGEHSHAGAPAARYVPTGQSAHSVTLALAANCPAGQVEHTVEPGSENDPIGQAAHPSLPNPRYTVGLAEGDPLVVAVVDEVRELDRVFDAVPACDGVPAPDSDDVGDGVRSGV